MGKSLGRAIVFQGLLAMLLASAACNKIKNNDQVNQGQGNAGETPPGMPGGQWPGMAGGGPGRPRSPLGESMVKLGGKGQSLTKTIGNELKTEPTPWDAIQPQAKEYAQLASSLSKYDPPKGDKDSWTKLTGAFSKSATALEQAADAKDKTAALAAHQMLETSCKACHDAHRGGRGGRGGMGMPPGGFRGPGGPGGPPRPPQ